MTTVTAFEAKTRFGELLDRVARVEEIVITRHDRPVARIVPEGRRSLEQVRQAVAGLNELRARIDARTRGRAKLTDTDVRRAIDRGRL
jgi:prevent-host-death family protein